MTNATKNSRFGGYLKLTLAALLTLMLAGCTCGKVTPVSTSKIIIGEIEPVTIKKAGLTMSARIDTGAQTSSLNAQNITRFERDGKRWVRFTVIDTRCNKKAEIDSRLVRTASIKRHGGPSIERPVVRLKAALGKTEETIEFTLADRSSFEYPVLIGRNFLDGKYVVDVSKKNSRSPMNEEGENEK